jgi:membrane fusion protein, multidrug efflux system
MLVKDSFTHKYKYFYYHLYKKNSSINLILEKFQKPMHSLIKSVLTFLSLFLITCLAFYPKIKETYFTKKEDGIPKTEVKEPKVSNDKKNENKGKDNKPAGKTTVKVIIIRSSVLQDKIQTAGSILANEEVEIRSEISGRLTKLYFKEGDFVKKGAALFQLNDEDLKARLRKLQFNKKLAEDNEFRQKKLLEKEAISQREYDIAVNSVNTIQADIEDLQAQLAKYVVRAPFDGKIGLRYISEGAYISPTTRIANLTSLNPVKLDFSIPAKYAQNVAKGSKVQFSIDDNDEKYSATVFAIDPKIDPQTRTLQLRASAPNPKGTLIPGAFTKIELVLKNKTDAILIPTEAVIPEATGSKVFIVENGKAKSVKVKLGVRGEKDIEVLGGLSKGDTLITIGTMQVKPDGEVEIKQILN